MKRVVRDEQASMAKEQAPAYLAPLHQMFSHAVMRQAALVSLGLLALILFVYSPVRNFEFVNIDDLEYLPDNPHVRTGLSVENIRWAFTTGYGANWFPLTWMSYMVDVQLHGLDAGWHHLTNVALHAASAVLLFLLLYLITGAFWPSALVAALFALHPMRAESVAWVAERKDVLCTFFWMLTLGAYVAYLRRPAAKRYVLMLAVFALGLMSKPMLVTMPFVLLLLDIWPLRRFSLEGKLNWPMARSLVIEKMPMFAVVIASSAITYYVQSRGGSVSMTADYPMPLRIENAFVAYVRYMGKMIWPANLAAFYPYNEAIPAWQVLGSLALLLAISLAALAYRRRAPYLLVGWFIYLGTLVPVIGLVKIGSQSIADRYTYIPHIGLLILLVWSVPVLLKQCGISGKALPVLAGVVLLALTLKARSQVDSWKDSMTLWTHAANVVEDNAEAHSYIGTLLTEEGKPSEAELQFETALRLNPKLVHAHAHYGALLLRQGRLDQAIEQLRQAQSSNASLSDVENNLGVALAGKGDFPQAVQQYEKAIRLNPAYGDPYSNWGIALANQGDFAGATAKFREALRLSPDSADLHNNLGAALASSGQVSEAVAELRRAVSLRPNQPDWLVNLAVLLIRQNDREAAKQYLEQALRLVPNDPRAVAAQAMLK